MRMKRFGLFGLLAPVALLGLLAGQALAADEQEETEVGLECGDTTYAIATSDPETVVAAVEECLEVHEEAVATGRGDNRFFAPGPPKGRVFDVTLACDLGEGLKVTEIASLPTDGQLLANAIGKCLVVGGHPTVFRGEERKGRE